MAEVPTHLLPSGGKVITELKGLWQPLFDRQRLTNAGGPYATAPFFTLGQGGRTEEDTNVQEGGGLPGGNTYSIHGFAVKIVPDGDAFPVYNDILRFQEGLFRLVIGNSEPFQLHLGCLGGFGGIAGQVFSDAAAAPVLPAVLNNGGYSVNDVFLFPDPLYRIPIEAEGKFQVNLTWDDAVPWTPSIDYLVYVYILGDLSGPLDRS